MRAHPSLATVLLRPHGTLHSDSPSGEWSCASSKPLSPSAVHRTTTDTSYQADDYNHSSLGVGWGCLGLTGIAGQAQVCPEIRPEVSHVMQVKSGRRTWYTRLKAEQFQLLYEPYVKVLQGQFIHLLDAVCSHTCLNTHLVCYTLPRMFKIF